jgi:hypothetical protein
MACAMSDVKQKVEAAVERLILLAKARTQRATSGNAHFCVSSLRPKVLRLVNASPGHTLEVSMTCVVATYSVTA